MGLKDIVRAVKNDHLLVTTRLEPWLIANPDVYPIDREIVKVLARHMVKAPRSRTGSLSSSSRGDCLRAQVFKFRGVEVKPQRVDTRTAMIFGDGHWRHLRWQALLLQAGIITDIEVGWQKRLPLGAVVRGTLDGANKGEGWGLEIKGTHTLPSSPHRQHLLQIHTYMIGTGINTFSLVYDHKTTQEYREFVVQRDESIEELVKVELAALDHSISEEVLPPIKPECKKVPDQRCPYASVCHGATWGSCVS